jgi:hypothetical protein
MVVDELVFGTGKLEQLREDGIDDHVFWLVLEFVSNDILELVKCRCALSESSGMEVAVKVYKELGNHIAIEIELVDGIDNGVSDEGRGNV